jgi:hypothetical protein
MPCPLCEVHPAGHSPAVNRVAGLSADGVCWEDDHAVSTRRERPQCDSHDPGSRCVESDRNRLAERRSWAPVSAVWVDRRVLSKVGHEPAGCMERQLEVQLRLRDARSGDVRPSHADVAALSSGVVGNTVIPKGERRQPKGDRARYRRRDTASDKRTPHAHQPSGLTRPNIAHRLSPRFISPLRPRGRNALC